MYVINRSNQLQEEYYVNPAQQKDVSETDFSESVTTNHHPDDEGESTQARLNSYQQAQLPSRTRLQQMQQSYLLSGGNSESDLFLDEDSKSGVRKRRLCCIVAGLLVIQFLMLVISLATIAALAFTFWKSILEHPTRSLDQAITVDHVDHLSRQIDACFDEVDRLDEVLYVSNEDISVLRDQLNHLIEITHSNFATIEAINLLINQLDQLTENTQNNFTLAFSQVSSLQNDVDALNSQATSLQSQIMAAQSDVASLHNQADGLETSVSNVNSQVTSLQSRIMTAQSDVASLHSQANGLETSVSNVNSRLSSPVNLYQNCQQENSTCNITASLDNRLFCNTRAIRIDTEVSIYRIKSRYTGI